MLRILNLATFTTVLLISASVEAHDSDITVVAKPLTLASWSKGVTNMLEDRLIYPESSDGAEPPSGIVSIRFQCGENGAPTAITISRKSGARSLDYAAMRAVKGIKTLHPMPLNFKRDQQYEANILFATSLSDYATQLAQLRKEATSRNAWFSDGNRTIALNVGFQPIGQ